MSKRSEINSSTTNSQKVLRGWEHSVYAHSNPHRFSYIGKTEKGEPEWIDHGKKPVHNEQKLTV
jgi:hypothetical protein